MNGSVTTDFNISESSPNGRQNIAENQKSIVFLANTNYRNERSISVLDVIDIIGLGTTVQEYELIQPSNIFPNNILQNNEAFSAYVNCNGEIFICDLSGFIREQNNWSIHRNTETRTEDNCDKLCSLVCEDTESEIRSKRVAKLEKLRLFPNPTSSFVNIVIPKESIGMLTIYNSNSVKVESKNIKNSEEHQFEINTESYVSGIYFVILQTESKTYFEKLVINK
jgi:hypothetical protein